MYNLIYSIYLIDKNLIFKVLSSLYLKNNNKLNCLNIFSSFKYNSLKTICSNIDYFNFFTNVKDLDFNNIKNYNIINRKSISLNKDLKFIENNNILSKAIEKNNNYNLLNEADTHKSSKDIDSIIEENSFINNLCTNKSNDNEKKFYKYLLLYNNKKLTNMKIKSIYDKSSTKEKIRNLNIDINNNFSVDNNYVDNVYENANKSTYYLSKDNLLNSQQIKSNQLYYSNLTNKLYDDEICNKTSKNELRNFNYLKKIYASLNVVCNDSFEFISKYNKENIQKLCDFNENNKTYINCSQLTYNNLLNYAKNNLNNKLTSNCMCTESKNNSSKKLLKNKRSKKSFRIEDNTIIDQLNLDQDIFSIVSNNICYLNHDNSKYIDINIIDSCLNNDANCSKNLNCNSNNFIENSIHYLENNSIKSQKSLELVKHDSFHNTKENNTKYIIYNNDKNTIQNNITKECNTSKEKIDKFKDNISISNNKILNNNKINETNKICNKVDKDFCLSINNNEAFDNSKTKTKDKNNSICNKTDLFFIKFDDKL